MNVMKVMTDPVRAVIDIIHGTGLDTTSASRRTLPVYGARSKSGRYLESKAAAVEDLQLFPRPLRSSAKV